MTWSLALEHVFAGEQFGVRQKAAVATDRVVDFQAVLATQHEIVLTVAGRGVYRAGTGLEGDVIADDQQRLARVKGMLQLQAFEGRALAARDQCWTVRCRSA